MDPLQPVSPAQPPQPVVPPAPAVTQPVPTPVYQVPPAPGGRPGLKIALILLLILVVIGGGYVAYTRLYVRGAYQESNLLTGLISKYNNIYAATYQTSAALATVPRDADAVPYSAATSSSEFSSSFSSMAAYLPADMKADISFALSADWQNKDLADWKANLGANGDFGDLTYKINVDALKKGNDIYMRVNNMPSLFFLPDVSNAKGQWVKIDSAASSSASDPLSTDAYKKNHDEFSAFLTRAAALADQNKLLAITGVHKEDKDGRRLTRYDLKIRKEALLPIYTALQAEYASSTNATIAVLIKDPSYLTYLQSPEFDSNFDYYEKNTHLTVWVDGDGYPAVLEYTLRVVPPDTATQLAGKQVDVTFKLTITDINAPVNIEAPQDAKSMEEAFPSFAAARSAGDAAKVKSELSSLRGMAEIYWSQNGSSYGKTTTSCSQGMFADTATGMAEYTKLSNYPKDTVIICHATPQSYVVSANLPNGQGFWCVDNLGSSKAEKSQISATATSCK